MYAVINLPGSSHFEFMGPASKKECESWMAETVQRLLETELLSSAIPKQIISNKEADSWKYRDGSKVFPEYFFDTQESQVVF